MLTNRCLRPLLNRSFASTSTASQQSWESANTTVYKETANDRKKSRQQSQALKPPPMTTPEELVRQGERRVQRAERLERKDLTAQLTPTKTYMGGFTQPRHLAFLNPLDKTRKVKDSYAIRVGENRVRPQAEAYEPHVVYLATTRYMVRWGHGRATRRECFSGFCKESELVDRFKILNGCGELKEDGEIHISKASKEYTELAVWPGSPEARSWENKMRTQSRKALAMGKDDTSTEPMSEAQKKMMEQLGFLPPVVGFVRPLPPYSNPTLIFPLMTVTLPTRPLASTLARLCNAHSRGLPFYASVPDAERKDGPSFFRRLLRMRANRIQELTALIVDRLDGNAGGFFGLRLNEDDKGRGVEGENLSEALNKPERGWAVVRWLQDESEGWNGLERQVFQDSWAGMEGVRCEEPWSEYATKVGEESKFLETIGAPDPIRPGQLISQPPKAYTPEPTSAATPETRVYV